ncbi:DUF3455 domain-containing protein [Caldimonas sp. KR1-144]|uniref:DUF3455 domain-containing protein n=1 Tax=Caldimonas sp. KR1-144 TaxID=3400911 RepID=UPI003C108979
MRTVSPAALAVVAATAWLAACGQMPSRPAEMAPTFSQEGLPEAVRVPAGHRVAMETVGIGEITYECRAKAGTPDAFEWAFVGPMAQLRSRTGAEVGRYWGPPATWASSDGSAITGTQVAVAPAAAGSIALQLVKAGPATGAGAMSGVAYVQRVATQGGVAPAKGCDATAAGRKEIVKYQADYIFWKAS